MQKNDKSVLTAWAMYDWANSVYSLSISSAIFPLFYEIYTKHYGHETMQIFGHSFKNTAVYSYTLSFAFLLNVILVPFLSGIADSRGNKKSFMRFFILAWSFMNFMIFMIVVWNSMIWIVLSNSSVEF